LKDDVPMAAEETVTDYMSVKELEKEINTMKKMMEKAAKDLDFIEAARLRDKMLDLKKKLG
jgi:excinuclease ABC subunit B